MKILYRRRSFLQSLGAATAAAGAASLPTGFAAPAPRSIPGFERAADDAGLHATWKPVSDRRIRVGIIGYGYCRFGADFSFQTHPNVEVVAVSDLVPDRCAELARACKCSKTYPSLEELIQDDRVEAVFIATDAPSHARQAMAALKHGKHVACAVPATFGSLEDAQALFEAVKSSGLNYMMFETSCFHEDLHAMRVLHQAGELGKVVYAEGEYWHFMEGPLPSYKDWRVGLPPQWYPTHSNAYSIGVTRGSFTDVSCMGIPSRVRHLQPANNAYKNPFGTEIALFRTSEGGMARMGVSWDTPGFSGESGRIRGERGSYYGKLEGFQTKLNLSRPPLPPGVSPGGHGGSHGHLTEEFIRSILEKRKPLVDITMALNLTAAGIVAHQSALQGGELLKIPQYRW